MFKEKVLVIEDDDTTRNELGKIIEKEGFEVFLASNGKEGLEIFHKEMPEIVITELKMPEMDGIEVMHTVKRLVSSTQVILITAFGDYDTAISALREGALDYLKKPIDLNSLSVVLGRAREKIAEYTKSVLYPTILLVEDEETTRTKLGRVLQKEGWNVVLASDGEEGIKVFQETKVDIALIDLKMPKKDGLQVLHEMRTITKDFEAIILTGYGDESSAVQAVRDGAINFIRKPIDLEQLIVSVRKALEKLNSERALKYRIRELELAHEVVARITTEREIVVDIRNHTRRPAREFAQLLLDAMPIGLIVIDKDMNIIYANEQTKKVVEYVPERINDELVKRLERIGIKDLNLGALKNTINRLFESKEAKIETINLGKYAYVTATKLTLLAEDVKQDVVLVILRGERPSQ